MTLNKLLIVKENHAATLRTILLAILLQRVSTPAIVVAKVSEVPLQLIARTKLQ